MTPEYDNSTKSKIKKYIRQETDRRKRKKRRAMFAPVRWAAGLLALALAVWFLIEVYGALHSPLTTQSALASTVSVEISTMGYFVRSETLITADCNGILQYTLRDGDKVAARALYANVYDDKTVLGITQEINEIEAHIAAIKTAMNYTVKVGAEEDAVSYAAEAGSTAKLSEAIYSGIQSVNRAVKNGNFAVAETMAETLKNNVVSRDFAFSSEIDLENRLKTQQDMVDALKASIGERQRGLYSPAAGYFTASVDGYETCLTTDGIASLTVEGLNARLERGTDGLQYGDTVTQTAEDGSRSTAKVVGKVMTNSLWYFAVPMSQADAAKLTKGYRYELNFDAVGGESVTARVYAINGAEEDSEVLVIFSCAEKIPEIIGLRKQAVQIVVETYTGLRVPKAAVRVNGNGEMGVYVITGLYAEFKAIHPVYETREYYIVETDTASAGSLLLYDRIIVSGKKLSDGKVVG